MIPSQAHDLETLYALKSGKTIFDAEVLRQLNRLAAAAERLVAYYEKVFEETAAPVTRGKRGSDA
jgi:hypothetical protein